jgi:copper oxidase (laccase) domain-containing protein
LNSANRRQLLEAGLRPEQIETLSVCTVCQPEFFYSFRRAKDTGRMVTAIRIIP